MGAESPSSSGIYLLPWFVCTTEIHFGRASVAPLRSLGLPEEVAQLAGTYLNQNGYPCEVTAMWLRHQDPGGDGTDTDFPEIRAHAQALAVAAIAENSYFTQMTQPLTAAHFDTYFHRFVPGMKNMTIVRRRREGQTDALCSLARVRFTVPSGAAVRGDLALNQSLLDALAAGIGSADPLDERIQKAVGHFLDANRLDDYSDAHRDVVWLGAAFENLLDPTERNGRGLSAALVQIFATCEATQTSWTDWKGRSRNGAWLARWAEEFYDHRSAFHGHPPHSSTWQTWEHAWLGTVIWTLTLKHLLAVNGRYPLSDRDQVEAEALDARLAGGTPVGSRWERALTDARWMLMQRNAAARLHRDLAERDESSTGSLGD